MACPLMWQVEELLQDATDALDIEANRVRAVWPPSRPLTLPLALSPSLSPSRPPCALASPVAHRGTDRAGAHLEAAFTPTLIRHSHPP
eukprot:5320788-Prymnesium_polylepis.1